MLKLISSKKMEKLYRKRAMFPEDWCQAQLDADKKAILDRAIVPTLNIGNAYMVVPLTPSEYYELKEYQQLRENK